MKIEKIRRRRGAILLVWAFTFFFANLVPAQTSKSNTQWADQKGELQFAAARKNPLQLRAFLKKMPKGADLHYHLSGGAYPESLIHDAVEDGLCVDTAESALVKCVAEADTTDNPHNVVPAAEVYRCEEHRTDEHRTRVSAGQFVVGEARQFHEKRGGVRQRLSGSRTPIGQMRRVREVEQESTATVGVGTKIPRVRSAILKICFWRAAFLRFLPDFSRS